MANFLAKRARWTWLGERSAGTKGPWAIGCHVCAAAGYGSSFGKFIAKSANAQSIKLHMSSSTHRQAVEKMKTMMPGTYGCTQVDQRLGATVTVDRGIGAFVPTCARFRSEFAKHRRIFNIQGTSSEQEAAERPATAKETQMDMLAGETPRQQFNSERIKFCLAESIRDSYREALSKADVAVLMEDKHDAHMTVRFACCTEDEPSSVVRGTLGMARCTKGSAEASMQAIKQIVKDFSTPDFGAPGRGNTGKVNRNLFAKISRMTEGLFADGAPTEVKALQSLQRSESFPHLVITTRDKSHASRSIYQRPWKVLAPRFQTFMDKMVLGKHSAVSIIHNSPKWTDFFMEQVNINLPDTCETLLKSLGWAPHRFVSHQKPFSRIVLTFGRFIKTCSIVCQSAGIHRRDMQNNFCDTDYNLAFMMLAAMADAATTGIDFVRCFDKEVYGTEETAEHVLRFQDTLLALFGETGIVYNFDRNVSTFTGIMMRHLRREHVIIVDDSGYITFGGLSVWEDTAIITEMKRELQTVVKAMLANLQTDFPSEEMAQNFRVFNLDPSRIKIIPEVEEQCLKRIANEFSIDYDMLFAQYHETHHFAARRWAASHNATEAWCNAVVGLEKRSRQRGRRLGALRSALCRWQVMTFSTAGLEHGFSSAERIFTNRRRLLSTTRRCDELIIANDAKERSLNSLAILNPQNDGTVIYSPGPWGLCCQAVFRRCWPNARRRRMVRKDKGKRSGTRKFDERQFLWKRKHSVQQAREDLRQGLSSSSHSSCDPIPAFELRRTSSCCGEAVPPGSIPDLLKLQPQITPIYSCSDCDIV